MNDHRRGGVMTTPTITRVDSDGRRLVWHCSTCDKPIHNGAGWIELVGEQMRCAHDRRRREDEIEARHRANGITSAGDYIDLPGPARWRATCRVCNGDDTGSGYFIDVDRIATVAAVLNWTAHLSEKVWHPYTDWPDVCRMVAAAATGRAAA
jgi:hypothetical protein